MNKFKKTILSIILKIRIKNHRNVFYINGAETLPPPLSHEDETKTIALLDNDDNAKNLLIKHNLRLVVYIAKKFENTGTELEDLISIGTIGLIKAINTFKSDKNIKLATYASRCIENEILMHIRKNGSFRNEISIDEPLNIDWDGNELLLSDILGDEENGATYELDRMEEKRSVLLAVSHLPEREKIIIEMRYGLGKNQEMTQKEVADLLGISQSYISRLEKKILKKLKSDILNLI